LRNYIYFLSFLFVLVSCKSRRNLNLETTTEISKHRLIKKIKLNQFDAQTFESRFNIKYKDVTQNFNGNGKLRILKDSIIWGSINFMGIPVVKFYLTPSSVQYYNKIEKKYYSGDYRKVNDILGADLNFYHLQNIFLGNSLSPSSEFKKYQLNILPKLYRLTNPKELLQVIDINPSYKVVSEKITPDSQNQIFIRYSDFKSEKKNILPQKIRIIHNGNNKGLTLDLFYKNINIDKDLHYPFHIPENYSKIDL